MRASTSPDLFVFPTPGGSGKSIFTMDVHPSVGLNPPGPTTTCWKPFAPEALYEFKIATNGDAVAFIAYQVRSLRPLAGSGADRNREPASRVRRPRQRPAKAARS